MIEEYFNAFVKKDINTISNMFAEDIILQDPFVERVQGKGEVLSIYREMFSENEFDITLEKGKLTEEEIILTEKFEENYFSSKDWNYKR